MAEECRIDVNILRIEFNPDNDLATQARHIQHAKHVKLKLRLNVNACGFTLFKGSLNLIFHIFPGTLSWFRVTGLSLLKLTHTSLDESG